MDEKITLDKSTFKALASDTRINILKSLKSRRKTLTELSKVLGMSPSSVKEHTDSLVSAGLIMQKDDGHKWKYYELTPKGKSIGSPSETKIWIVLAISAFGLFFTALDLARLFSAQAFSAASKGASAPEAAQILTDTGSEAVAAAAPFPYMQLGLVVLFFVALVVSVVLLVRGRKNSRN